MRPAWVLGQHRADDDLLAGDHELAVVPGEVALLVAHHPHVGVGDVRSRLGVVAVGAWLVAGAPPAAPLAGRGGCVPGFLFSPLRAAAGLVLGGQPVPGGGQPLPPFGPAGQRPRCRRRRITALAGVVGGVGLSCLGQQFLDLRQRLVRLLRGVAGQLGAIQAQDAQRHHALGGQQPQHLAEQPSRLRRHVNPHDCAPFTWSSRSGSAHRGIWD